MPINNFLTQCDQLWDDWKTGKYQDPFMPEPYYGDPNNCSIVIVNLNPGEGSGVQHLRQLPNGASSYSGFAPLFPHLNTNVPSTSPGGDVWWGKRKVWLDRLCNIKGIKTSKLPFAIEIWPWHTTNWAQVNKKAVRPYVQQYNIIDVIIAAIQNSDAKFGVVVGSAIMPYLKGYVSKEVIINPSNYANHNIKNWPINNKGTLVKRTYRVLLLNQGEVKILVTSASGSNQAPAAHFKEVEEQIIKQYC